MPKDQSQIEEMRAAKPGAMKEQSQIDAMRAAIRGDIERARTKHRPSPMVQPEAEV